jgi:glycosyltransferase involved in cell wall biosynthesis
MTNQPLLSIIVPVYNTKKYLDVCIQSILNQKYKNIELILVNDGSKDGSEDVCKKYSLIDDRVIFINKSNNEGLIPARKTGIEVANGDYIGFVDSDDYIEKDMFISLIDKAIIYDTDIVIGGHKEILHDTIIDIMLNTIPTGYYSKNDLIKYIYPKMIYTGVFSEFGILSYLWNKIFKKEVIYNNLLSINDSISIGEDAACTYSCMIDAKSVYITDDTKYIYRQRINSMVKSNSFNNTEIKKYIYLYNHLKNKFNNHILYDNLINQLQYFLLSLITVRSSTNNKLFGFCNIPKNSKLALVGAGTFGQNLYQQIINTPDYSLSGWYDSYYKEYQSIGLNVLDINQIKNNYDYIIIGFINAKNATNIKSYLIKKYNIEENKFLILEHYKNNNISQLLQDLNLI